MKKLVLGIIGLALLLVLALGCGGGEKLVTLEEGKIESVLYTTDIKDNNVTLIFFKSGKSTYNLSIGGHNSDFKVWQRMEITYDNAKRGAWKVTGREPDGTGTYKSTAFAEIVSYKILAE